jgi:hypothetical protein
LLDAGAGRLAGRRLRADAADVPERVGCAAGLTLEEAQAERDRLVALRDRLLVWLADA